MLVSVAISAHNIEDFIGQCVDSVLAQTYPRFEVIVVDDGSEDGTPGIVQSYADPRVRLVRRPVAHGGPSKPRNVAIAEARGELVMILDGDDYLSPDALAWVVALAEQAPEAGLLFFNNEDLDLEGRNLGSYLATFESFWQMRRSPRGEAGSVIDDPDCYRRLIAGNFIRTSGVTMPRSVLERVGGFDESLTNADDWDMWLRVARAHPLGFIDRPGAVHRARPNNLSARGAGLISNRIRVLERQLERHDDELVRETASLMLSLNHFMMAYELRVQADLDSAEEHYRKSLGYRPNWRAARGIAVTKLTKILKPARNSRNRKRR